MIESDSASFSKFGEAFIADVMTPELLQTKLLAVIPPVIYIDEPHAAGNASISIGTPSLKRKPCEYEFRVPLKIKIHLGTLNPFGEIDTAAQVELTIIAETRAPATIYLRMLPIKADAIRIDGMPPQWFDVIERIIRDKVAEQINTKIRESEDERTVDLEAMVPESRTGTPPIPALRNDAPVVPVGPSTPVSGALTSSGSHAYGALLRKDEQVRFLVYCQTTEIPPLLAYGGTLARFTVQDVRGKILEETTVSADLAGWGENYTRHDVWFTAPRDAMYRFRVRSDNGAGGLTLTYRVKQERHNKPRGDKICFDEFGSRFMHGTITPDLVMRELKGKLPAKMTLNPVSSRFGRVKIEVKPTVPKVLPLVSANPDAEVFCEAQVSLAVTIKIEESKLIREPKVIKEVRLTAVVRLRLRAHAALHPTSIILDVDPVEAGHIEVDESKITGLGIPGLEKFLRGLVADQVRAAVAEEMKKQLDNPSDRTVNIPKLVEEQLRPDVSPPARPGALPTYSGFVCSGSLKPGKSDHHPLHLKKGQKVKLTIRVQTKEATPYGWGMLALVGICDMDNGVLDCTPVAVYEGGGKKWDRTRWDFEAPEEEDYKIVVCAGPWHGEDYRELRYQISSG